MCLVVKKCVEREDDLMINNQMLTNVDEGRFGTRGLRGI